MDVTDFLLPDRETQLTDVDVFLSKVSACMWKKAQFKMQQDRAWGHMADLPHAHHLSQFRQNRQAGETILKRAPRPLKSLGHLRTHFDWIDPHRSFTGLWGNADIQKLHYRNPVFHTGWRYWDMFSKEIKENMPEETTLHTSFPSRATLSMSI